MADFKMHGFRDLERALAALPRTTAKASARRVLKKAGKPIAQVAAEKAPRRQGDLSESYVVGTRLNKRQRKRRSKPNVVEVYVGTNNPAGVQTEFGNEHQTAQPHLRPAWDTKKGETLEIISAELAGDIARTTARLAKRAAKKS